MLLTLGWEAPWKSLHQGAEGASEAGVGPGGEVASGVAWMVDLEAEVVSEAVQKGEVDSEEASGAEEVAVVVLMIMMENLVDSEVVDVEVTVGVIGVHSEVETVEASEAASEVVTEEDLEVVTEVVLGVEIGAVTGAVVKGEASEEVTVEVSGVGKGAASEVATGEASEVATGAASEAATGGASEAATEVDSGAVTGAASGVIVEVASVVEIEEDTEEAMMAAVTEVVEDSVGMVVGRVLHTEAEVVEDLKEVQASVEGVEDMTDL